MPLPTTGAHPVVLPLAGEPALPADLLAQFEEVALPHLPQVARFALSLTRDEADADDLVQETYLRAYRAWHTFEPGSTCRAWLFTICRNTFVRARRREQRREALDDAPGDATPDEAALPTTRHDLLEAVLARTDLRSALQAAIARLPEPFRDAVVLVDVQDLAYAEAATVLAVPVGTVRSRLFRARRLLQDALLVHAQDAGFRPSVPPPTPSDRLSG